MNPVAVLALIGRLEVVIQALEERILQLEKKLADGNSE